MIKDSITIIKAEFTCRTASQEELGNIKSALFTQSDAAFCEGFKYEETTTEVEKKNTKG